MVARPPPPPVRQQPPPPPSRRSQAETKAMNMKIKKVPWWNKRSRLERRLILISLSLVLVIAILIAAIVLTVQSYNSTPSSGDQTDLLQQELELAQQESQFLSNQQQLIQFQQLAESQYCLTKECIQTAADLVGRMDPSVDPCDDFYEFACGGYVKKTIIPEDKSRTSMFSEVGDTLNRQIKGLLEEKISPAEPVPFKLAKSLYHSCMDVRNIEMRGVQPLLSVLRALGGWPLLEGEEWDRRQADTFKWYELVWRFRDIGYSVDYLLDFSVTADMKNSSERVLDLDQPSLGLSREYLLRGLQDHQVAAYYRYMQEVAILLGASRQAAQTEMLEVLMFETQLANISLSGEERRDSTKLYNPMMIKDLYSLEPATPWLEYINNLLTPSIMQVSENETVIVDVPRYVRDLGLLLAATPVRVQANYLMWRAAGSSLSYLSSAAQMVRLRFSRAVTGKASLPARWVKCVSTVTGSLPNAVGALYVSRHFTGDANSEAHDMVSEIRAQFGKMLREVDWMDPVTRAAAIDKAEAMTTHIGYPPQLLDMNKLGQLYTGLKLNSDDYFGNALRTTMFGTNYAFSKLRQTIDKHDWVRHGRPAVVNAFYSPLDNSIQFPAGILQGVFFNSKRPKYMNYGAIGWVIGHEITHGFDDQGRQFDKNGDLADWWDEQTKQQFLNRSECMVEQYSGYSVGGLAVNGVGTQGENVADNGGVKQAYRAYNSWVARNGEEARLPGLDYSPSQLFWLSGASVWCAKYREQALRLRLMSGVHSPDMVRVQATLANMPEFARDWQCPAGSNMNPVKKCSVW